MARLDEKYSVASSTQEVVASPCSIASTLATSPTIRHEVRRLYGRVDQSMRTSRSGATFNVSALATKKQSSIKEKSKKLKKDRVVVVCMPVTQFTLPRRKKRDQLVSAEFVKELSVADDATEKELQAQLDMLFPGHTSFIFLSVLQSHELVPATLPHGDSEWTGASLLTLVHNGSIYVRPKAQKKKQNKSPSSVCPIQPPPTSVISSVPPLLSLASSLPVQSACASSSVGLPIQSPRSLLSCGFTRPIEQQQHVVGPVHQFPSNLNQPVIQVLFL